ncbi:MAG: class I adenylate-forming enzyme family protein [bacterium]
MHQVLYNNSFIDGFINNSTTNTAIITKKGETNWQTFNQLIDDLAANLVLNGLQKGDRCLFLIRPSLESIVVLLAIMRAGGVVVAADIAMGMEVFESRVKLANPTWVFIESVLLTINRFPVLANLLRKLGQQIPNFSDILKQKKIVKAVNIWFGTYPESLDLKDLMNSAPAQKLDQLNSDQSAPAQIIFTSGTTAAPKAVVHSTGSFLSMIELIQKKLNADDKDVFYTDQYYIIFPALYSNSKVIVPGSEKFSAKKWLAQIAEHKVTITFEIPSKLLQVIDYCLKYNLKIPNHLHTIIVGSSPVLSGFLHKLKQVLYPFTKVWCIYGMTEILPIAGIEMTEKLEYKGTGDILGKPFEGVKTKLLSDGELVVGGSNQCWGYLPDTKLDQINTGDICRIDEQGRLVLLARKKDMIIKGNYNIYPTLFEKIISEIEGVNKCAMIGQYNNTNQEEQIVLFVEPDSQVTEKQKFIKSIKNQLLSGKNSIDLYAQPDTIILLDHFPHSGRSQKIDKQKLKKLLESDQYA